MHNVLGEKLRQQQKDSNSDSEWLIQEELLVSNTKLVLKKKLADLGFYFSAAEILLNTSRIDK